MAHDLTEAELDGLLARSAPVLPADAARSATQLARETAASHRPRAWWRQRAFRVGALVGAAMVLAGAGTMAAYELSIPPFQTTPPGVVRIQPGIPVDYTNSLGRRVECLAFMEFMNIDKDQQRQLAMIRESPIWAGWGNRTLRDLGLTDAPTQQQFEAISTAAAEEMQRQASVVIPDLVVGRPADGPVYSGSAMSCANPGGIDGQP